MLVEAELKAVVRDVNAVSAALGRCAPTVENADILVTVLTALGVEEFIAFQKNCVNYRFAALGRDLHATLVTVPELENQTFIELETMAEADDLNAALDVAGSVLRELGISEQDLTAETYTDAITAQRRR